MTAEASPVLFIDFAGAPPAVLAVVVVLFLIGLAGAVGLDRRRAGRLGRAVVDLTEAVREKAPFRSELPSSGPSA